MLHVYRASAGSGKTYKLTLEYLKLLLSPVRPNNEPILPSERNKAFQHILAVTFTNKATEEMKRRIIEKRNPGKHRRTSKKSFRNFIYPSARFLGFQYQYYRQVFSTNDTGVHSRNRFARRIQYRNRQ